MPETTSIASCRARAEERVLRGERRRRVRLFEHLEDCHRLRDAPSVFELEDGHAAHWVLLAERGLVLLAAGARELHGHVLVLEALVRERDAHAPRRGASPKAVELHARPS